MWTNTLKPTDILSEEQVQQIHDHAMQILQEIGVDFLHPRAIDLFRRAGLSIDENRVRFEAAFIEEQIKKVPATFQVTLSGETGAAVNGVFCDVMANGPAVPLTVIVVLAVLTPPPLARLSRATTLNVIVREIAGSSSPVR